MRLSAAYLVFILVVAASVEALEVAPSGFVAVETRYVTDWKPYPTVRTVWPEPLEVNALRCRLKQGDGWGEWWEGRVVQLDPDARPVLRIPVRGQSPGTHRAMMDMRTPLGAEWREIDLPVPIVARYAGEPIRADGDLSDWPHRRYPEDLQPESPLLLAWDMGSLYVAATAPGDEGTWTLDLLPAAPMQNTYQFEFPAADAELIIPWNDIRPAGPYLGETLRLVAPDGGEFDVLLVGSGLPIYFGATMVSHGPGGDDQGPPRELLEALYDLVGFDLTDAGADWGRVQREDPGEGASYFDWSPLHAFGNLHADGLVYVHAGLWSSWAEKIRESDPERYRELARRYLHGLARECLRAGVKTFSCGWNEPELFHFSDREKRFLEDLDSVVGPIREVVPDARIMAGKFSSGSPDNIRSFVRGGFRDNFDILDIHPYNNDPRTGCDTGQVVAAHEVLAELGMGRKRIFLGEGWGPTRDLHQKPRASHREPVSPEEADFHRRFYWNGYRCLTQPRTDYDPEWVIGAKYFTFNDNVGGTYWKRAARPHYNAKGELDYYLIGNLQFSLDAMHSFFCNGGLVDFYGKPKGTWLFDFPPALPQVRARAELTAGYLLRHQPEKIRVTVTNAEREPLTNLAIGLRPRNLLWNGELTAASEQPVERKSLEPGGTWEVDLSVTALESPPGPVRMAVEVDYDFDGLRYCADDVVRTGIREPVTACFEPAQVVADPGTGWASFGLRLENNRAETVTGDLFRDVPGAIRVTAEPATMDLGPRSSRSYRIALQCEGLTPGIHDLKGNWGTEDAVAVVVPVFCLRMGSTLNIDGELSDWPEQEPQRGLIRFGTKVAVSAGVPDVPFPVPEPVVKSVIGATAPRRPKSDLAQPEIKPFGARAACAWDPEHFYLAVVVEDTKHVQDYAGADTWRQDSVQIALDPRANGPAGNAASVARFRAHLDPEGYNDDDYELSVALTPQGPEVARVWAPGEMPRGKIESTRVAVVRGRDHTVYELALPWAEIGPFEPKPGAVLRMDLLVNDVDEGDRVTLGWGDGIAEGKYPSRFTPVVLSP